MAQGRKWITWVVLGAVAIGVGVVGVQRWHRGQHFIDTEDAYVSGSIHTVASRVPGVLLQLTVRENQPVQAGDTIATMDPRDFDAAVVRAETARAEAEASLARLQAVIEQAQVQVGICRSALNLAQLEQRRATELHRQETLPTQDYDRAMTAATVADGQWQGARKAVAVARADLEVGRRRVDVATANLEATRLQRSYCTLVAPATGLISRKAAEVGQVVAAGQPICAVVPLGPNELWVEANYKETQLRQIQPGQRVTIRADVDGGRVYHGRVESLSAGTGSVFSLFPPENATGNWVKVVQRLPVRIALDPTDDSAPALRLGLSVTVSIDTEGR